MKLNKKTLFISALVLGIIWYLQRAAKVLNTKTGVKQPENNQVPPVNSGGSPVGSGGGAMVAFACVEKYPSSGLAPSAVRGKCRKWNNGCVRFINGLIACPEGVSMPDNY